jgi:hypothetical protein
MASREQIFEALSSVYDTCSVFNGTRLDIARWASSTTSSRTRAMCTSGSC